MTTVNIYLNFSGNCEEAFTFYKSVFGGEFNYIGRFKDMPPVEGCPVPEGYDEKIMHVGLPVSPETMLLGSDCFGAGDIVQGNNFSICVTPADVDEAHRIFNALATGGAVVMPLEKQFWGSLNGMLTDRFGINWMIDYELKQ